MVTLMKNRGENLVTQFLYNLIFFFLTTLNGQSLEIEERGYKDCNGNYMVKNFPYALVLNCFEKGVPRRVQTERITNHAARVIQSATRLLFRLNDNLRRVMWQRA